MTLERAAGPQLDKGNVLPIVYLLDARLVKPAGRRCGGQDGGRLYRIRQRPRRAEDVHRHRRRQGGAACHDGNVTAAIPYHGQIAAGGVVDVQRQAV